MYRSQLDSVLRVPFGEKFLYSPVIIVGTKIYTLQGGEPELSITVVGRGQFRFPILYSVHSIPIMILFSIQSAVALQYSLSIVL